MAALAQDLELHPRGDYVSDVIRLSGTWYELPVLEELQRRLGEGPPGVLVDVGAMIGNHTAYLATYARHSAIHAFEPSPANLPLLRANTARFTTVEVHPLALSSSEQILPFRIDEENRGHSRVDPLGELEVPAIALDSLSLLNVRLVKLDVEGHEPEVLRGAWRTIDRWHPLIVLEDWHGPRAQALPSGYQLAADWGREHQTYLYAWAPTL